MKIKIMLSIIGIVILSCSSDDDTGNKNFCDFEAIISAERYDDVVSDQLTINSLEIDDNCLNITFSASGCDGMTWELTLIDSEDILESNPPQRNLRFSLVNEEACAAVITKTMSFDISELQLKDVNRVYLNIKNSDDQILYQY